MSMGKMGAGKIKTPKDVDKNKVNSFDLDKEITRYAQKYNNKSLWYDPTGQKIESMRPSDHKQSILDKLEEIYETTACYDCPLKLKCNKRNWEYGCEFAKVIGCDLHPDQKRFPGHSTLVELIDTTLSGQLMLQGVWATARAAASASSFTGDAIGVQTADVGGGEHYIVRSPLLFNTTSIPVSSTVSAAYFKMYQTWAYLNQTGQIQDGQPTYPSNPVDLSDYAIANQSGDYGTIITSVDIGAWQQINFTDVSVVVPGSITKHWLKSKTYDIDNSAPGANLGANWEGPTNAGGHDPIMGITYDTPPVPPSVDPADGRSKCQDLKNNVNWLFSKPAGSGVVQKMMQELT